MVFLLAGNFLLGATKPGGWEETVNRWPKDGRKKYRATSPIKMSGGSSHKRWDCTFFLFFFFFAKIKKKSIYLIKTDILGSSCAQL